MSGISQIILGSDQIYRHFLLRCQQKQVAIQVERIKGITMDVGNMGRGKAKGGGSSRYL